MPKCLVPNCQNRYKIGPKKPRTRSFFQVPQGHKDPKKWKLAKQWLDFCHIDITKFIFRQHQTICEDHFEPHLIERIQKKVFPHGYYGQTPKRLARGSVPTLLPAPAPTDQEAGSEDTTPDPPRPPRDSIDICEKIRYQPKSVQRKEVADLARYPPDLQMPASNINSVLTCGICRGYFRDATTITECLHTFCKSCLVKHFYQSLHCPTCEVLVHPSDPFSCIKIDHTMQDVVDKMFPDYCKEEALREINFYRSEGLDPPQTRNNAAEDDSTLTAQDTKIVSVMLDYIGTSPHLPPHYPLMKNFLRIPDTVTVRHIQKFLKMKMRLPSSCQAGLFVNMSMLSASLTVKRVEQIFGRQSPAQLKDFLVIEFGVIPVGDYFQEGLIISTKDL